MSDSPRYGPEIRPPSSPLERASVKPEIRVGDPLPPKYLDVLKTLKPEIPMAWRTKAFEAAYYVHSFDINTPLIASDGTNLEREKRKFARQLARTDFFF